MEACVRLLRIIEERWERHCQDHIDNEDVPSRCDPVIFRHAVACAGYCPVHLGNEGLPAHERLQQFTDRSAWRRHISRCIPKSPVSVSCPLSCPMSFHSEMDLWHHLGDVHSADMPEALKKRKSCADGDDVTPGTAKKRKTSKVLAGQGRPRSLNRSKKSVPTKFVTVPAKDTDTMDFSREETALRSSLLSIASENRNVRDRSIASISAFSVTEQEKETDSSGTSTPLASLFDCESAFDDESLSLISILSPPTDPQVECEGDSLSETSDFSMPVAILEVDGESGWEDPAIPTAPTRPTVADRADLSGAAGCLATGTCGRCGH